MQDTEIRALRACCRGLPLVKFHNVFPWQSARSKAAKGANDLWEEMRKYVTLRSERAHQILRSRLGFHKKACSVASACRKAYLRETHDLHCQRGGRSVLTKRCNITIEEQEEEWFCSPCAPGDDLPVVPDTPVLVEDDVDAPAESDRNHGEGSDSDHSELDARSHFRLSPIILLMNDRISIARRTRGSRVPIDIVKQIRFLSYYTPGKVLKLIDSIVSREVPIMNQLPNDV